MKEYQILSPPRLSYYGQLFSRTLSAAVYLCYWSGFCGEFVTTVASVEYEGAYRHMWGGRRTCILLAARAGRSVDSGSRGTFCIVYLVTRAENESRRVVYFEIATRSAYLGAAAADRTAKPNQRLCRAWPNITSDRRGRATTTVHVRNSAKATVRPCRFVSVCNARRARRD